MTIWDDRYKSGEGLRWWPNEELVRFLGKMYGDMRQVPARGKHALELGCGTGCNLIALTAFGFFAHGVDASDDALQVAQEYINSWALNSKAQYGVSKIVLPETLHWPAASMDLVVDCQTIQHLSDDDHVKVYSEIYRALKPGGRFWSMHFVSGQPDIVYAGAYPELRYCSVENQRDRLRLNGFRVDDWSVVSRTYNNCKNVMLWAVTEAVKP